MAYLVDIIYSKESLFYWLSGSIDSVSLNMRMPPEESSTRIRRPFLILNGFDCFINSVFSKRLLKNRINNE